MSHSTKKITRTIAIVLSLVMLVSIAPIGAISVSADSTTAIATSVEPIELKFSFFDIVRILFLDVIDFFRGFFIKGEPVETEEQAIEIAKAHMLKRYKNNFEGYEIKVKLEGEIWTVYWGLPSKYDDEGNLLSVTVGGGGPSVKINKSNGRVVYCMLQS